MTNKIPIVFNKNHASYKTLDEYIVWFQNNRIPKFDSETNLVWFMIKNYPETILSILHLETNIPSKHDLTIIEFATNNINNMYYGRQILEYYKNRKL